MGNPNPNTSGLTPYKKGQSGNPAGRPRDVLKHFQREEFEKMTNTQKKAFLKKVAPLDRWKMTEGNPDSKNEITGEDGGPIKINVNFKRPVST